MSLLRFPARLAALLTALLFTVPAVPGAASAAHSAGGTLTLIVPYPMGGILDQTAHFYADRLAAELGRPVIVSNRAGGAGVTGIHAMLRAHEDSVVALSATSPIVLAPHLAKTPYDPLRDVAPVAPLMVSPVYLVAGRGFQADDFAAVVERARANPGSLAMATSGLGSIGHLMLEQINRLAGIHIQHVPHSGMGTLLPDTLDSPTTLALVNAEANVNRLIRRGQLKLLAVSAPGRLALWPDTPTLTELGLPDANLMSTFGFFAPASCSADFVDRLHEALARITSSPEAMRMISDSMNIPAPGSRQGFARLIRRQHDTYAGIVRDAGISRP